MIPPKIKPLEGWQPGFIATDFTCVKPVYAREHFVVNATRQAIMRALVSSRCEIKGKR